MTFETSAKAIEELDPFVRWSKPRPDTESEPGLDPDHPLTGSANSQTEIVPLPRPIGSKPPSFVQPTEDFNSVRNWEGVVLSVGEDTFFARVRDPDEKSDLGETTLEVPIEDVTEDEKPLLTEGAVFYLTLGYRQMPGQPRRKDATLIFRRMPAWSKNRLAAAQKLEKKLTSILKPKKP